MRNSRLKQLKKKKRKHTPPSTSSFASLVLLNDTNILLANIAFLAKRFSKRLIPTIARQVLSEHLFQNLATRGFRYGIAETDLAVHYLVLCQILGEKG